VRVDIAERDQEARGVDRVVDVDRAPLAVQTLAVGAAVAAAAAVVDVDDREAAAGPVLDRPLKPSFGDCLTPTP
jgi:hypothetical protein